MSKRSRRRVPRAEFPKSFLPDAVAVAADAEMEEVLWEDTVRIMRAAEQAGARA